MITPLKTLYKAVVSELDYKFDFGAAPDPWLRPFETIDSYVLEITDPPDGALEIFQEFLELKAVTAWMRGGTSGATYLIDCTITTDNVPPRVDVRRLALVIF